MDLSNGLCAQPRYRDNSGYDWFSDNPVVELKTRQLCSRCPVKFECAQTALNTRENWGIWGGMEEFRMRRALGVNAIGDPRIHLRKLLCPFCYSDDLEVASKKEYRGYPVKCRSCGIEWPAYRTPDKAKRTLKRYRDKYLAELLEDAGR